MQINQRTSLSLIEKSSNPPALTLHSFTHRHALRAALCLVLASAGFIGCALQDEGTPRQPQSTRGVVEAAADDQSANAPEPLYWKGYTWNLMAGGMAGGMRADPNNVSVDANGDLHLRLVKQPDGKWKGAELYTQNLLGYGTYQWQIDAPMDSFTDAVLGLFNYGPAAQIGQSGQNEIDIEFSRWSYPNADNLAWTIWPPIAGRSQSSQSRNLTLNGNVQSTPRFVWSATSVSGFLLSGFAPIESTQNQLVESWTFAPTDPQEKIPQQALPLGMNLWCFPRDSQTPCALTHDVEVIIHDFQFIPQGDLQSQLVQDPQSQPVQDPQSQPGEGPSSDNPGAGAPTADPDPNLARAAAAYAWSANADGQSNDNRVESAGLNDGDFTNGVILNAEGEGGSALWEAAGLLWSSPRTISSVAFTNGAIDSDGNGYFQSSCSLQFTTDGQNWRDAGWSLSVDYPYSTVAGGQSYTFSGPELSAALGVRVTGQTGAESWSASIAEVQATGK